MNKYLQHLIQNLPHQPGVYKMKNAAGGIIYIGKAKDLKNRVSSYFQAANNFGLRTIKMVEQIADIEYITVYSELEALILENNLIKEFLPKYNVLMKDDKNFVYIKITVGEPYPRIYLVRKSAKDGAKYFGPKTAIHKVVKTMRLLKNIFPYRYCQLAIDYSIHAEKKQSSKMTAKNIENHKKHCLGPCITSLSPKEYQKIIAQLINFFEGRRKDIMEKIKAEMLRAAAMKEFEKAASIRDKLKAIEEIIEPQRVSDPGQKDLDIINYVQGDEKIYFNLFQLREGKLIGQENFIFYGGISGRQKDKEELSAFLSQYYEKTSDMPQEILIPHAIEEAETIEKWLYSIKGKKTHILAPERGKKNHLLELSLANAQSFARQSKVKWHCEAKANLEATLAELQNLLKLQKIPERIECYDISHLSGTSTAASMVVFESGWPKKEDYRKFKLRQEQAGTPNDVASMKEVLIRRLKYLKPAKYKKPVRLYRADKKGSNNKYVFEINKKRIGNVKLEIYGNNTSKLQNKVLLRNFQVKEKENIQLFIKKILEKFKLKRLYLACKPTQKNRYEEFGFQEVKMTPYVFQKISKNNGNRLRFLVYDKTKYAEDKSFNKTPDLIIVDGGKGQLVAAQKALKHYDLTLPIIALAKREEEIFLPKQSISIRLPKNSFVLRLIQQLRDEAHRFALAYNRNLRSKVQ